MYRLHGLHIRGYVILQIVLSVILHIVTLH